MGAEPPISGYVPDAVERFGRRIKVEYLGMVSIYMIIGWLVFRGLPAWYGSLLGAIGGFFLFMGLKKKTRDHFSGSLVLLAATLLARPAVVGLDWVVPFTLFAACVCAMEGYVEKLQEQILALPLVFLVWGFVGDRFWLPALALVALYLTHPWTERPGLRRRLALIVLVSAAAPLVGTVWRWASAPASQAAWLPERQPLTPLALACTLGLVLAVAVCEAVYWRRLLAPHRWAPLPFAVAATADARLAAMFAMVSAVLLTATVFRQSVDSARLRPLFKHAEWYYFWIAFAVAVWTFAGR